MIICSIWYRRPKNKDSPQTDGLTAHCSNIEQSSETIKAFPQLPGTAELGDRISSSGLITVAMSPCFVSVSGYGHTTPKTNLGKLVCLFYAILGIPLNVVTLNALGHHINDCVRAVLGFLKRRNWTLFRFRSAGSDVVTQGDLTAVVSFMAGILIIVGSWGFCYFERWSYLDSFYYSVITLTTIGEKNNTTMTPNLKGN